MAEPARAPELWLQEAWHGRASPLVRAGLSGAAVAYRAALAARAASYRIGLLSTRGLPVPVISVGNVTVGGSGKTPLAEEVALALREMGARPALISRGYGRRTRGVRIVADGGGGPGGHGRPFPGGPAPGAALRAQAGGPGRGH